MWENEAIFNSSDSKENMLKDFQGRNVIIEER